MAQSGPENDPPSTSSFHPVRPFEERAAEGPDPTPDLPYVQSGRQSRNRTFGELSTRGSVSAGRATEVDVDRLTSDSIYRSVDAAESAMSFQASAPFPPVMRAVHVPRDLVALLVFGSRSRPMSRPRLRR
jgi:hypothetical protein